MASCLMVQGTASHVGKSIVAAGFCRVFSDMGLSVAPFKSQNMSLNSFVTREGGEIARAQELQARAARVEPSVLMNPLLLKPRGAESCEVLVLGTSAGDFSAREYGGEVRPRALEVIRESLEALGESHDVVVIEGAGSPAEINLRRYDLCNMKVARMAQAPVLLVADIDDGGALAAVVGTLALLRPWERDMVGGVVVNKFRGDFELLVPGLRIIERKTGKKVLGVLPFIDCSYLDEEDTLRDYGETTAEIAVVRLPYTSNFTDFTPLARAAPLKWVTSPEELEGVRAVIVPGSRNTVNDLQWLVRGGMAAAIRGLAAVGVVVIGVCGGYQILGEKLLDPEGVEGVPGEYDGLSLLPVTTRYERPKTTRQVTATVACEIPALPGLLGRKLGGYEIHTGRVEVRGEQPLLFDRGDGRASDGAVSTEGTVFGTHLHGLFDDPDVVKALLERLGIDSSAPGYRALAERSLDELAGLIKERLDVEYICGLMGI